MKMLSWVPNTKHDSDILLIWMILIVTTDVQKSIGKKIGNLTDRGKHGTFSLYFGMEMMCSLYYNTMYRGLFTKIPDVYIFVVMQLLHCGWDWLAYGFRSTTTYWNSYNNLRDWLTANLGPWWARALDAIFRPPGIDTPAARQSDHRNYLALELGLRFAGAMYSGIGFILVLGCQAYGTEMLGFSSNVNQYAIPVHKDRLGKIFIYFGVAVVMEIINVNIVERLCFWRHGISIFVRSEHLFKNRHFFYFTAGISFLLMINIVYETQFVCETTGVLPNPLPSPLQHWGGDVYQHAGVNTRWYWLGSASGEPPSVTNVTCVLA